MEAAQTNADWSFLNKKPFGFMMSMQTLACALDAFICLRLGVLLFRAAPNSQVLALTTVVIDGDKTTRMESAAPQFTPATSPTNPV
ncbi:hypothetical protein TELCIR_01076 [Teladorsagia circumcincta]|uniref:Uncharacterized protein n=1 Tax=Teladorsagia circumcincta TaxID=45464 RepID=A0A2G9V2V7_TELCI|nr:hypothetical protein TELCIR_01076 [Teladorsagia circumcincta]